MLPREHEDAVNGYVGMHSGERERVEQRPFRRKVDFWAFSVATALARGLEPRQGPVSRWGKLFIYTSQIMDEDLGSLLAVVSVARLGHDSPETGDPKRIVDVANRLAAAGCPVVLKQLSGDLQTTPLDRTLELAQSLLDEVRSESAPTPDDT